MATRNVSAVTTGNDSESPMRAATDIAARARERAVGRQVLGYAGPTLAPWQAKLAVTIMGSDPSVTISISEIAYLCRLSVSHFVRAFSNTMGITPYAWFMRQRIVFAQQILVQSGAPLAQIALECGFSDQAHFTKAFVKATGMTPAKWRRGTIGTFATTPDHAGG
ncbi:helix-turn-helix domain-containing protein [Sphingomonas sanxanigenens]|uniref:helix-turn-helix domain-containing protein n=1 Tax=Sphingomonas sanxanigenens TaxID=397260 RepID=UPI001FE0D6F4|nr:helix-turn-helix transcriptional regulator [Sphingomonas sanxanigenens]